MRYYPQELMIMRLKGRVPRHPRLDWLRQMTNEECLAELRRDTGKDFGSDVQAWDKWFKQEKRRWEAEDRAAEEASS